MLWALAVLVFAVLAVFAARGRRGAYLAFVVLGVLFLPVRVGFDFAPESCLMDISPGRAVRELGNYQHLVLFFLFSLLTYAQFPRNGRARFWITALVVTGMGVIIELEQALTGRGQCRVTDLIPDVAGLVVATGVVALWHRQDSRRRGAESA